MEDDSSYSAFKRSSTSAKCLKDASRRVLAKLDLHQSLPSQKGCSRDYRGLAGLMGFTHDHLRSLERHHDVTMKILESWEIRQDATLNKLIEYLEDMERHDIIEELLPSLRRDVAEYREPPVQINEVSSCTMIGHSNNSYLTLDDVINGECTIYDAYLSYADEDRNLAFEFAQKLTSTSGLKLYFPERDMLAGLAQLDTDIEMIMHRCRNILMILTPNFIGNPTLEFKLSFATSLAIERNEGILIPVILEPCEIPPVLSNICKIDFTNKLTQRWMWRKLALTIRSKGLGPSPSLGSCPINLNAISNSAGSTSDDMD